MVAYPHPDLSDTNRHVIGYRKQQCCCSIHLFTVLMKWLPRHSSLSAILAGFVLLYFFFRKDLLLLPAVFAALGFGIQPLGEWIHVYWMKTAHLLGRINGTILLFVLYFLILTPVALTARLMGKISMRKNSKNALTVFLKRNHRYTEEDLKFPW
jgi:hypothetical protein